MGVMPSRVLNAASVADGINAVRMILPLCWFDADKCADGLQALRHYRYEIDEHGQWGKLPLHDENSHYADAFEQLARSVSRKHDLKTPPEIEIVTYAPGEEHALWMG